MKSAYAVGLSLLASLSLLPAVPAWSQQAQSTTRQVRSFEIVSVDGNQLVVREDEGPREYTVPEDFRFTVDGTPLSVRELRPGMKGTATITTTVTSKPVYVTEVRSGEVVQASASSVIVRGENGFHMYTPGEVETKGIRIFRDGKRIEMQDLRQGDRLTATFVTEAPPQTITQQQVEATLAQAADTVAGAVESAGDAVAGAAESAGAALQEGAAQAGQAAESTGAGSTVLWAGSLAVLAILAYLMLQRSRST